MVGDCDLCKVHSDELVHLPLYVNGSEGCNACLTCRIALTTFARAIKHASSVAYKEGIKLGKKH